MWGRGGSTWLSFAKLRPRLVRVVWWLYFPQNDDNSWSLPVCSLRYESTIMIESVLSSFAFFLGSDAYQANHSLFLWMWGRWDKMREVRGNKKRNTLIIHLMEQMSMKSRSFWVWETCILNCLKCTLTNLLNDEGSPGATQLYLQGIVAQLPNAWLTKPVGWAFSADTGDGPAAARRTVEPSLPTKHRSDVAHGEGHSCQSEWSYIWLPVSGGHSDCLLCGVRTVLVLALWSGPHNCSGHVRALSASLCKYRKRLWITGVGDGWSNLRRFDRTMGWSPT